MDYAAPAREEEEVMERQTHTELGVVPAMNNRRIARFWALAAAACAMLLTTASADPDFGYPFGGGGSNDDMPDTPVLGDDMEIILALAREQSYVHMSSSIRDLLSAMLRRQGRGFANLEHLALSSAGPEWGPLEVTVSGVGADIELSDLDVGGSWHEAGVGLAGSVGSIADAGLSLNTSRTLLRGRYGSETTQHGADAYFNLLCPHGYGGVGLFLSGADLDFEDRNGNGGVYGAGLSMSTVKQVGNCDLSAAVSVSRFLRDVETREYDTLLNSLLDVQTNWTETVGTSVYAFFSDSLLSDLDGDRTFGSVGVDLVLTPNDRIGFTVGVEKLLGLKEHRKVRLSASLIFAW